MRAGGGVTEARLDEAAAACARDGAQLTALRRAVLRLVMQADHPPTAYQLLDRLKLTHANAVPPTVYRALDFLMTHGLVHKVERLGAFIACTHDDHGHRAVQFLICRNCGTVTEIEDAGIATALATAAARKGFRPGRAVVELDGICAACAAAAAVSTAASPC